MTAPRTTVVIPHYNDALFLREAVASIREAEPVEILVVADASTDPGVGDCLAELERGGVRVVRQERNAGPAEAVNRGAAAANGRYVFRLDSDDMLKPGALGRLADGWVKLGGAVKKR